MTNEAFIEWKKLDETKEFLEYLGKVRSELLNAWASGHFTAPTLDSTAQLNSEAIGRATQLRELMEITYDDISREF